MTSLATIVLGVVLAAPASPASPGPAAGCTGALGRDAVVRCAVAASPVVQAAERGVEVRAGERLAARTVLPANPMVEVTAASRVGMRTPDRDVNVYGRLTQEIEIAGQRRRRIAVADAAIAGQQRRVEAARREVAAEALRGYYAYVAAREEQAMLGRIAGATQALVDLAAEGEKAGLTSPLQADVAAALVVKVRAQQVEAERRRATARALLAGLVGGDPAQPAIEVEGDLTPIAVAGDLPLLVAQALARRAELEVAKAERETQLKLVEYYKRARAPNPQLVAFAQRDGFAERVLGGGLAIPIPLPSPLGRTYKGEIAASQARARQAEAEIERLRREVRAEVVAAFEEVKARRAELALYDPQRVQRAEDHVTALAQEMASGRVPIRDGVVLQQALLELLAAQIEAKHALGAASVELARATGLLAAGDGR